MDLSIYRTICHKVEDVFVKTISKKQNLEERMEKVNFFRNEQENLFKQKQAEKNKRNNEKNRDRIK